MHHGNDARRRWRAKRAYSYWLRCVELRAIDRIWIFARRRRLWQRAMRAWRNGALGMAFTYWLDARLAGSNRRALAAAALLFRHGRSVKLALLCWQDLVGAKLMLATANAAPKVRSLLNALRRSFALMARLGRIHHLVLLLLDRTYRREMRRGLAALAVGLSDWRRLGLRPFGRASIRRRIHAMRTWRSAVVHWRSALYLQKRAKPQQGRQALRRWRVGVLARLALQALTSSLQSKAGQRACVTATRQALRRWRAEARRCRQLKMRRSVGRWMGDWLVRWRRHAARHALMARAALAALHVERKRALNSWHGACEDADYVHARLRAAGGLLVERARAKPFRTWKRQQQQGAKARFIMQRRLNSELFGAAMLWRAVAADAVVAGRLMELAIHRWLGNALALGIVRWRVSLNEMSGDVRAVAMWRHRSLATSLRTWFAPDKSEMMFGRAVRAWRSRALASACRRWFSAITRTERALSLMGRCVLRDLREAWASLWRWRLLIELEGVASQRMNIMLHTQTLHAWNTWAYLCSHFMRPARVARARWLHKTSYNVLTTWKRQAFKWSRLKAIAYRSLNRKVAAGYRQWEGSCRERNAQIAIMRRGLSLWVKRSSAMGMRTWVGLVDDRNRKRDAMKRAIARWMHKGLATAFDGIREVARALCGERPLCAAGGARLPSQVVGGCA